jgi:mRNA interferase RelE/StbE
MSALYKIILSNNAKNGLKTVPIINFDKMVTEIQCLAINPRPFGYKKLTDREAYRIRVGNYRIIYDQTLFNCIN